MKCKFKELKENMKYGITLYKDLANHVWMQELSEARLVCGKIEKFEKEHPVCNWIAKLLW